MAFISLTLKTKITLTKLNEILEKAWDKDKYGAFVMANSYDRGNTSCDAIYFAGNKIYLTKVYIMPGSDETSTVCVSTFAIDESDALKPVYETIKNSIKENSIIDMVIKTDRNRDFDSSRAFDFIVTALVDILIKYDLFTGI